MQRKYSEVISFIPAFPADNSNLVHHHRDTPISQRLYPQEIYHHNHSTNVIPTSQFSQHYLTPQQISSNPVIGTPNLEFVERRVLPSFNSNIPASQPMNSHHFDYRHQISTGKPNQPINLSFQRKVNPTVLRTDVGHHINATHSLVKNSQSNAFQPIQYRKPALTSNTTPQKYQGRPNNSANISSNIPNQEQLNNQPINNIPRVRDYGKIAQSVMITDNHLTSGKSETKLESMPAQMNNKVEIEKTNNFNSPVVKEAKNFSKIETAVQLNRKKLQVWKSLAIPVRNNQKTEVSTFNRKMRQEDNQKISTLQKKINTNEALIEKKDSKFVLKTDSKEVSSFSDQKLRSEQQELKFSPDNKFRKKNDQKSASIVSLSKIAKPQEKIITTSRNLTMNDFEVIDKIGKGAYGDVFLARQRKTKFVCVLKSLSKKKIKELKIQELVFREIKIQMYLVHRHITSLYGVFDDETKIYLIMECMPDGCMSSNGKKKISENEASHLLFQVCQGLRHIHRQDIIHRDIKPENLLLNNTYLKIGDFGCAVFGNTLRKTVIGSYAYISPEQFCNNPYDGKIDSWCVGILAYEMLTGKPPYQEKLLQAARSHSVEENPTSPMGKIAFQELKFPPEIKLSEDAIDFMKRLLDPEPGTRADIKEALRHRFMEKAKEYQKYLEARL